MRHVLALFDAPFPAAGAVTALAEAGFAAEDVALLPTPPALTWPRGQAWLGTWDDDEEGLARALASMGVPEIRAHQSSSRRNRSSPKSGIMRQDRHSMSDFWERRASCR